MREESQAQSLEPQNETAAPTHTDWHLLLALLQEAALTPVHIEVLTEVIANLKSIKIDVVLLRRKSATWTPEQKARLVDGIRQSTASHILCEFKYTQSVNQAALVQALMYDHLYRNARKLRRNQVATFVVSARTPQSEVLQDFGYAATALPGIYRSEQKILAEITLIILNELRDEPHNALFRCFASQRRARIASFATLEQVGATKWSPEVGEIIMGLQTVLQKQEEGTMKEVVISPEYVKKIGKEMQKSVLASLTPELLLARLTPDQILEKLSLEQRLAGLNAEQRLAGLNAEQRLAGLETEVIEAYLQQRRKATEQANTKKKPVARRKSKSKSATPTS
jgi:hypothetical protein